MKNNLIGTFELANLALEKNVSNFVFISTDKAVNQKYYGCKQRLAELNLQALNDKNLKISEEYKKTKFSIVRFGNVLESSGSVIQNLENK